MSTRLFGGSLLAAALLAFLAGASRAAPPATAPATAPAPLLTADEAKEVDAVIASMVAAGFPDARGATVYSGTLSVSAGFDPAKDAPPLPTSASNTQMTDPNSAKVTYGFRFDGLHFKLPDGSWVIALSYRFKPKAGDKVDAAGATEIAPATITADAMAAHPFDVETGGARWLEKVAPAQRERARASMRELAPVTQYLRLSPDELAPAVVLLKRAGWAQADEMSLVVADQRARSYWQLRPWTKPDAPFDPTGAYATFKEEEEAWRKATPAFTSEPPAAALRRAMFRFCRAQLAIGAPEDALLSADVAAAGAKAAVDPKDPQGNAARIDALAAGMKLPVTPAEGADLATRLQSWEARPRQPRMVVTSGGNGGGGQISMSTAFVAPAPAYVPDKKDLDALVALLGDERPSRFADFSGAHPAGDNAWRALATLLKADPRTLAGHPTDPLWTPAERKAAAAAVQAWWEQHRGEYVGK